MSWYKIFLPPQEVDLGLLGDITFNFSAIKASKDVPETLNAFVEVYGKKRGATIYLTPDAEYYAGQLLEKYGATQCEKPTIDKLSFTLSGGRVTPELLGDD